MGAVVLIPGLAAIYFLVNKSHKEAFLYVYVTTLLMLPHWCRWSIPGLPDPTFDEAAILPIAAVFLYREGKKWKFSTMDFLVLSLLFMMSLSQYVNIGYGDAQNLMFDMAASGVLPYMLAKGIIQPNGMRNAFVKHFVGCMVLIFVTVIYEFRFGLNPFRMFLDPFFPVLGSWWVTTFRYGFARASAAYSHPILAGVIFMMGLQLQLWLAKNKLWTARFRAPSLHSLSKPVTYTWLLLGDLIMTLCRGPQLGAAIAWFVSWIGSGKNPKARMRLLLLVILIAGVPLGIAVNNYVSVGRGKAHSESQETAAYRKELIDKYVDIVEKRMWLGWGIDLWPKVPSMPSIDNSYLLMSLRHGVIATGTLVCILLWLMIRLYRNAMRNAPFTPRGTSLSFTMLGIYVGFAFSIATVYIGESLFPVFLMLVGFTEGYLMAGGDGANIDQQRAVTDAAQPSLPFRFERVLGVPVATK